MHFLPRNMSPEANTIILEILILDIALVDSLCGLALVPQVLSFKMYSNRTVSQMY